MDMDMAEHATCFVSYSWESQSHKEWVRHLASELVKNGVETRLDQWDAHLGMDLPEYMERSVRESDCVLLVCTPRFAEKANRGAGGVGYEKTIVTGELLTGNVSTRKFVAVLRAGRPQEALPSYLKSRLFVDFRDDAQFEAALQSLLRHILNKPEFIKPSLGRQPDLPPKLDPDASSLAPPPKKVAHPHFAKLFDYAVSYNGLRFDRPAAVEWVERWLRSHSPEQIDILKRAFEFAVGYNGLRLDRSDALAWAENWVSVDAGKNLDAFQRAFQYAVSYNGLRMERRTAEQWAHEHFDDPPTSKDPA